MILAVLAAFSSAAAFAGGSALQHRAVGDVSERTDRSFFTVVWRRPGWLIGLLLSAVAFTLHAVALSQGDLVVVQPIIVSGIVFAVLIRTGLERRRPRGRTLVWLIVTWGGLALFLLVRPATDVGRPDQSRALVLVLVVAAGALLLRVVSRRVDSERLTGILLGSGSGLLFGLVAGLVKLVLAFRPLTITGLLSHWPLWALVPVGVTAVIWNQRAYRATRLSISAPVLNVAQVVLALIFGVVVFGETAGHSTGVVVAEIAGLVMMITGIVRLATLDA